MKSTSLAHTVCQYMKLGCCHLDATIGQQLSLFNISSYWLPVEADLTFAEMFDHYESMFVSDVTISLHGGFDTHHSESIIDLGYDAALVNKLYA